MAGMPLPLPGKEHGRRGLRLPPSILHGSISTLYKVSSDARSALRIREEDALKISSALRAPCCARRSCSALRLRMRGFLFIGVFSTTVVRPTNILFRS